MVSSSFMAIARMSHWWQLMVCGCNVDVSREALDKAGPLTSQLCNWAVPLDNGGEASAPRSHTPVRDAGTSIIA